MATHTSVRAVVPMATYQAAAAKARAEQTTLEQVVRDALAAYAAEAGRPAKAARAAR